MRKPFGRSKVELLAAPHCLASATSLPDLVLSAENTASAAVNFEAVSAGLIHHVFTGGAS